MLEMTCDNVFAMLQVQLGPEARRHLGIDAPARRDTAIAGGSYRAPGTLVDGFRAGDGDQPLTGIVVCARASTAVLHRAKERGANLVISRQAFLGDSQDRSVARPEPALAEKLKLIGDNGLCVLRLQDPRTGPAGRAITEALPRAIGLAAPVAGLNPAAGLVYHAAPVTVGALARQLKAALGSSAFRLVGNPNMPVRGIAFATETSRPNALVQLLSRPDVQLVVAGEVHETETTAYVLDAIALGQKKALLLPGSVVMEEPAAKALAEWLSGKVPVAVHHEPAPPLWHAL